jgi:hypothetical protein
MASPSSSLFIHDQRLSRLTLRTDDRGEKLTFLKGQIASVASIDPSGESRWLPLEDRWELFDQFGRGERILLAITSYAGLGKSKVLEQLEACLPQIDGNLVTMRVQFADLPNDWQQYLNHELLGHDSPFFVKHFCDELTTYRSIDPNLPDYDQKKLRLWIEAMLRNGSFVLIIDGVDEYGGEDAFKKGTELRKLLIDAFPKLHCVVGSRPHAITETFWRVLFAQDSDKSHKGTSAELASAWEFVRVEMFDEDQQERFIGKELASQIRRMQSRMDFSPRSLEVLLRNVDRNAIATVRSTADLYWHSVYHSLPLDNRDGNGRGLVHTSLNRLEVLHILSAIAITMALWNDDSRFAPQQVVDNDGLSTGAAPGSRRKASSIEDSPGVMEVGTELATMVEFQRRVFQRLYDIYPEWKEKDPKSKRPYVEHWYHELIRLNSQYVEFNYFQDQGVGQIRWQNATLRDFFAALWMVTRATEREREAFHRRMNVARDRRDSSIAEIWRMICGMPEAVRCLSSGASPADQNLSWLKMVEPLYAPPNAETRFHGRPSELMYRAWPGLLYRNGVLTKLDWSEEDLLEATYRAQQRFGGIDPRRSDLKRSSEPSKSINLLESFLSEYPKLAQGGGEPSKIIDEDIENHWCKCQSRPGMEVRVGHSDTKGNPEGIKQIQNAFSIGAFAVTNRLYELFDRDHAKRFEDYGRFSPDRRSPAIYLNWYDAMMFSIWCHGYLPSELEWEYASRAEQRNPDGTNARYYWGNTKELLGENAWINTNSDNRCHVVGQRGKNDFGLFDTLGNVSEWCRNLVVEPIAKDGSERRPLRGGNYSYQAYLSECSAREYFRPHYASAILGCRVLRIRRE